MQLKAKDLRIGNYVLIDNEKHHPQLLNEIVKVTQ